MNIPSLAKGIALGLVVGVATYAYTNASRLKKRQMKCKTIKAVKSVSNMIDGLGSMFM